MFCHIKPHKLVFCIIYTYSKTKKTNRNADLTVGIVNTFTLFRSTYVIEKNIFAQGI